MADLSQISLVGSPVQTSGTSETVPPSNPLVLAEHEESAPFEISADDAAFLDRLGELHESSPLSVSYTSDGEAIVSSSSYVGVLTLPSGIQIEVSPKQSVTRLLWALQYAFDTPVDSMGQETEFATASSFFDAIGVLFLTELKTVLDQGLHRDYVRTQAVQDHVRGRIDVQRQLQRPNPIPTDFAVEYDEFTTDTVLNRAVLAAVRVLTGLVRDNELAGQLRHQEQRLRQFTRVEPVPLESVERIELSRLNEHYEVLLDLTRTVLAREFFEDISAGTNRSLALFVNMNEIFERLVERAFRAAAKEIGGLTVEGQASIQNIIDGPHAVSMQPDVLVWHDDGTPVAVIDAKWKTGSRSSGDVYQLTSYILALDTCGALVYPGHCEHDGEESTVMNEYSLRSVELATDAAAPSYSDYVDVLETSARHYLTDIL
ncbi:McrC family protein [Halomicroarcula sp. S1AR25-4]|uniref:McrC family protein n=1 Tax=Haloarcula sp. S1AR25-4 TaxID=2950538 RepID=UPI002875E7D9|nr:restriction endonuclease [Halomicroarcula sp. S1AR25-4]MDS0276565.1 McrC family protein [Halomicroarcula sp. S1AR25-4]